MANKRVSVKGKGADLFFGDFPAEQTSTKVPVPTAQLADTHGAETNGQPAVPQPTRRRTTRSTGSSRIESTNESASPSTKRPTSQPTERSTAQSTSTSTATKGNQIVSRPKAFYITERLDTRIDDAVRYFQQVHGLRKVDRSTVLNAMMDNDDQWTEDTLDRLVDRLISQLTSRLTGR